MHTSIVQTINEALWNACWEGNHEDVAHCLSDGANLNWINRNWNVGIYIYYTTICYYFHFENRIFPVLMLLCTSNTLVFGKPC